MGPGTRQGAAGVASGNGKARKPAKSKVAPRSRAAGQDGAGGRDRAGRRDGSAGLNGPMAPGVVPGHDGLAQRTAADLRDRHAVPQRRLGKKIYEAELYRLQAELVKMQEWVR